MTMASARARPTDTAKHGGGNGRTTLPRAWGGAVRPPAPVPRRTPRTPGRISMINAEAVRRISAFRAHGYPVISLYVSTRAGAPDVHTRIGNLLDQIGPLAADTSLARGARMSIAADLDRIDQALSRLEPTPGAV